MEDTYAKIIKTAEITFKNAKGMRDIYGKELHPYHEIFFFLGGDADFISGNGRYHLNPDTVVIIPKGVFHQFVVFSDEAEYKRIVINFDSVSELNALIEQKITRIMLFSHAEITALFRRIEEITAKKSDLRALEESVLLKALFAEILVLINPQTAQNIEYKTLNRLTENTLGYINKNLCRDLTVSSIAKELFVSTSHLCHNFKKELQISVYAYILQKRLVLANQKIKQGKNPTNVAVECGFKDYSGFFRQYKKMFGISPSTEISSPISENL